MPDEHHAEPELNPRALYDFGDPRRDVRESLARRLHGDLLLKPERFRHRAQPTLTNAAGDLRHAEIAAPSAICPRSVPDLRFSAQRDPRAVRFVRACTPDGS